MAIAVGQHATAHATSTATTASVTTAASGSAFLIFIAYDNAAANLSSVGDNKGNTYSVVQAKFTGTSSGGDTPAIACHGTANAAGGSGHTFTATSSNSFLAICAVEITGGATSLGALVDAIAIQATGTSPYVSGNVTVANANELLLSFIGSTLASNKTITAGNSFTSLDTQGNSTWFGAGLGWKAGPGAGGSDQGSWTISGGAEGTAVMTIALIPASGSGVTVSLTGSSTTTSQGTVKAATKPTLTGQAVTTSQGTLKAADTVAITGTAATTAQGTLKAADKVTLVGQSVTTALGTFKAADKVPLLGQVVTTARGTFTAGGGKVVNLVGQSVTCSMGSFASKKIAVTLHGSQVFAEQGVFLDGGGGAGTNLWYTGPVVSKQIDERTLVAAIDPAWKDPIVTYEFPNGRKFTEPQNDPAGYD